MNEPSNVEKIAAVAGAAPCSANLIDKLISRAEQACRYAVKHQSLGDSDYDKGFAVGGGVCETAIREHIMRHLAEDVKDASLLTQKLTYRRPGRVNRVAELKALSAVRSGAWLDGEK